MFIFRRKQKRRSVIAQQKASYQAIEKAPEKAPGLVLGIGEFYVKERGISAEFFPPLERLTNFYTWGNVPFGLSAMRALVSSDDTALLGRLVERLGLSIQECEMLGLECDPPAEMVVGDSHLKSISNDAKELLSWSFEIADWCPDASVADALRSISMMDVSATDQYVRSMLP